jgi:hypothetical protein
MCENILFLQSLNRNEFKEYFELFNNVNLHFTQE